MMEIVISQNENQNITIENENIQSIAINQNNNQNININNDIPQSIEIEQEKNQVVLVDGGGAIIGITDVIVNGVSVVSDNIAYILVPTKTSELINNSGYITSETDPTVPTYIKQISIADINNWNNKQNLLVSGSNIKTINNESLLGSGNITISSGNYTAGYGINIDNENVISNSIISYDDLQDLPTIPTQTSELINDSNYVTSNELSQVAFSGSFTDLSNAPDIPTDTSDLINDSGFITKDVNDLTYYTLSSNLSSVATSGDYDDLTNKPTIPTVNNATLTIQKNGTTIDTFTANSNTNTTVNVTVPTKTSDLTNDSGFITNNYVTYSTTETRIGTWINGKPIYRQVIETTTPSTTSVATLGSVSNLGIVTNLYGLLIASGQQVPLNFIYNTSDIHSLYTEGNNIMCKINYSSYLSKTCFVVIEYTKTTD